MHLYEWINVSPPVLRQRMKCDVELLFDAVHGLGLPFNETGHSMVLYGPYQAGRYEMVRDLVAKLSPNVKVSHSKNTVYDEADFERADLFVVYFADIPLGSGFYDQHGCDACGEPPRDVWNGRRPKSIRSSSPFVAEHGGNDLVSIEGRESFEERAVRGMQHEPFDEEGRYSRFTARSSLGDMVIPDEYVEGYRGRCAKCGRYLWTRYFGPIQHCRANWNGDDIVIGGLLRRPLYSRKALMVIRDLVPGLKPDMPVFLV
jgi:hypothetical protein